MNDFKKPAELFDLTGQIALVTGGSRGIGEAIAHILAACGAHVIVSSRRMDGCQQVSSAINASCKDSSGSAEAMECHIGDVERINELIDDIESRHGKLDILVNNAATNPYFGPILDTDVSAFQKTVDVNIRGYFFMSTAAAKLMQKQQSGSIINVASINGVIPADFQGIYSITKAAVISMTKAFAKECASSGIRVNALLPGATDTKFASALTQNDAILQQVLMHVPMKRIAQPEEMAGAVLFLASNAGSYTTGITLNVDGGYLLV